MRLLVLILLIPAHGILSFPMSSNSPEVQDHIEAPAERIQITEPTRTRRSITALLAAEVLFLEGILAAQNSKKMSKVKARKVARPVNNFIPPTVGGKHTYPHTYPHLVKQELPVPIPISIPTTIKTTLSTRPVSQLDPFVMLTAPDLSRNTNNKHKTIQQAYTDDFFPELIQAPTKPSIKREAKQIRKYFNKYGEYELYNPTIFDREIEAKDVVVSTAFTPFPTNKKSAERKPRKITQKYGAFDLYEPSFVIKQYKVKEKQNFIVRKNHFKKKATAKSKSGSIPFTYFHFDQVRAVHGNNPINLEQEWRKVRRRSQSVEE